MLALLVPGAFTGPALGQSRTAGRGFFMSPMGEPFRTQDRRDRPEVRWFNGADANGDGQIDAAEMINDGLRFFRTLDADGDGQVGPEEIDRYETEVAPEVRVPASGIFGGAAGPGIGSGGRSANRSGGAGRPGRHAATLRGAPGSLLNLPEPVIAADADMNRAVTLREFENAAAQRFAVIDRNRDGRIAPEEVSLRPAMLRP